MGALKQGIGASVPLKSVLRAEDLEWRPSRAAGLPGRESSPARSPRSYHPPTAFCSGSWTSRWNCAGATRQRPPLEEIGPGGRVQLTASSALPIVLENLSPIHGRKWASTKMT